MMLEIGTLIRKPWHTRKKLAILGVKRKTPPAGIIPGATFYLEDRRSRTTLKGYCRYPKASSGRHLSNTNFRVEWILRDSASIFGKANIRTVIDLEKFNPTKFIKRHLQLEAIDFEHLGAWLSPRTSKGRET
jgi:hypothetical protein